MSSKNPLVRPCAKKGTSMKRCAGCGTMWYCNAECQTADWKDHKAVCKLNQKDKDKEKNEPENGSGLGSILAALMPPPQRYTEVNLYNACCFGHHDELKKMLFKQRELDVNWTDHDDGCTAAYIATMTGPNVCSFWSSTDQIYRKRIKKDGHPSMQLVSTGGTHVLKSSSIIGSMRIYIRLMNLEILQPSYVARTDM